MPRTAAIIPEAPEREEVVASSRETPRSVAIEYPSEPTIVKKNAAAAAKFLTTFEQNEIEEYETLYFLAENDQKFKPSNAERLINNGFDDDEGYYRIQKGDHIAYRFQL